MKFFILLSSLSILVSSRPSHSTLKTVPLIAVNLKNPDPYEARRMAHECGLQIQNAMVQLDEQNTFFLSRNENEITLPYTTEHFKCLESNCEVISFAQQGTKKMDIFSTTYPEGEFKRTGICIAKEATEVETTEAAVTEQTWEEKENWLIGIWSNILDCAGALLCWLKSFF